jgi:hypothetical protein
LRSLQGRIAVHTSWANTENRSERTADARAAMWQKFSTKLAATPYAPSISGRPSMAAWR